MARTAADLALLLDAMVQPGSPAARAPTNTAAPPPLPPLPTNGGSDAAGAGVSAKEGGDGGGGGGEEGGGASSGGAGGFVAAVRPEALRGVLEARGCLRCAYSPDLGLGAEVAPVTPEVEEVRCCAARRGAP